jgi:hypothetical protein
MVLIFALLQVLKTRDYIHVDQLKPFDSISVKPRAKLMKSDFWSRVGKAETVDKINLGLVQLVLSELGILFFLFPFSSYLFLL